MHNLSPLQAILKQEQQAGKKRQGRVLATARVLRGG